MKDIYQTVHFLFNHPLTRKRKWSALKRFARWQFHAKILNLPVVYPFIEGSQLIITKGMTGATGNIYTGLHEFEEMGFLLHLLRPGDIFCDAGANIGSFTILASAVIKANTLSFEPVPVTFMHLKRNVTINHLESTVDLFNCGLGEEPGSLHFTKDLDTVNHVMSGDEKAAGQTIEVEIKTLDQALNGRVPVLIKMDVEGYELSVLKGAASTIKDLTLKAIIVELNGSCHRYGVEEREIHQYLVSAGFAPASYDPFERILVKRETYNLHGNTIYIRDEPFIRQRIKEAPFFTVLNQKI
jgi:FkbM family methyltransferase